MMRILTEEISSPAWPQENRKIPDRTVGLNVHDFDDVVNTLFAYLQNDLEREGFFRGQFGYGQRVLEEERYQTTKQSLDTKPRLYLTGWPVFVLLKHKQKLKSDEMLHIVREGVLRLLDDDWIFMG